MNFLMPKSTYEVIEKYYKYNDAKLLKIKELLKRQM